MLQTNELYALHLDGKLLEGNIWKEYSSKYGLNGLHGWRPPKRIYYKLYHAKNAIRHLPQEIRNRVEIVRYVPSMQRSSDIRQYQEDFSKSGMGM